MCPIRRTYFGRNTDNQERIHFREVVHVNPDMNKIIQVLLSLIAEQEGAEITYQLEKTA